jgi:AcrR family transcriptional regulator
MPRSKSTSTRNSPRKSPLQERSQQLVGAVIQAATRVLGGRTLDQTTTNEIAQLAGVSIGSLYQYFPNKEAIVAAVIRMRARQDLETLMGGRFAVDDPRPMPEIFAELIKTIVDLHKRDLALYQVLLRQVPQLGQTKAVRELVNEARRKLVCFLQSREAEITPQNHEISALILSASIESSVHAAVLEHPEALDDPAFQEALLTMVLNYLQPNPSIANM